MITKQRCLALFICVFLFSNALFAQVVNDKTPRKRVVVLHSYLLPLSWAQQMEDRAAGTSLDLTFVAADSAAEGEIAEAVGNADLILLDVPHESVLESVAVKSIDQIEQAKRPFLVIGDLESVRERRSLEPAESSDREGVSDEWAEKVRQYYRFGGTANLKRLIETLSKPIVDNEDTKLPEPMMIPESGFYHPEWEKIETELTEVKRRLKPDSQSIVGIAINRATISACDTEWLDALIKALNSRGLSGYAFYGPRKDTQRFTRATSVVDGSKVEPIVDLIINSVLVFRPQDRKQELDRIGVPVLQTLPARNRNLQQWRESEDGLPLADISYYYASSELAGMIDPVLVSARHDQRQTLAPVKSQIDGIADRAAALIRLRSAATNERRIAVFVYKYPPGENNFGASFLNVPKSLENAFQALSEAGYSTDTPNADSLTDQLQKCMRGFYNRDKLKELNGTDNAGFVSLAEYKEWFQGIPEATRQRIIGYWGTPESMTVTSDNDSDRTGFVIPRVKLGNAIVLPQPLRHELTNATGADLRKKRINHKSTVPLSHTYLATYLFVKKNFDAHAVIHFGTHGTQEWAPGKQRALAMDDEAMLAIGSLPNIYPYIMDNLGEATTAKRRGRATMISHLTPMFTPSGFRPGLHDMHVIMHDWETVDPGPVKKETERQLIDEFVKHKLDKDLGWSTERIASDFPGFMEVLHPYLDDVAQSAQPQGLAVFGEIPSEERRFGMVMQMLRKRLIDSLGEDIDEVFLIDAEKVPNSRPARWLRQALSDPEVASRLDLREIDRLDTSSHTSVPNRAEDKQLDQNELLELGKEAQRLYRALASNSEIDALLAALDGKHITSGYGGDPVRNPDSLPTGRNLYGFDPVRVPTQQSWKIGVGVLDDWIETYRGEHDGSYPTQIAFTLWAGETMRHHGVIEAQIFYALGIEPQWDGSSRMKGFEIIPSKELRRPRIDVLANVTGSYRDQFPHLMSWIDKAVIAVAELESPSDAKSDESAHPNYVSENSQKLTEELIAQGLEATIARRQATARVFSNESGTYGTGLNNAVYHSDLWDSQNVGGGDAEMSELFLHRMGHAYGEGLDGIGVPDLFARQMKQLDAVFLARSSNTYGVLTSDDPFAYLGSFALASRVIQGKQPELIVQNLRDPSEVILDPIDTAISKELQTRYLHPQWIRAQQNEGYSGTMQVLKATQFLWGWQAMSPDSVREDQWQSLVDVYIDDQYALGTREWFEESNHQALAQISERMLEAIRLNYWTPSQETQEKLARVYRESTDASGLLERNGMVATFVSEQFPDLESNQTPVESVASTANMGQTESPDDAITSTAQRVSPSAEDADSELVKGMELRPEQESSKNEKMQQNENAGRVQGYSIVAIIGLIVMGGIIRMIRSSGRKS